MKPNGFVCGKLRVCVRGFSEGKSDVANVQRPFDLDKTSNFLYTLLATGFIPFFNYSAYYIYRIN